MSLCYRLYLLFCCVLTSCQHLSYVNSDPEYDDLAQQEIFAFAREVQMTDQLQLLGYGGGFLERINRLFLAFTSPQYLNVDEARLLFFDIANRFLDRVNKNEALRPYMSNYPFTIIENLELSIAFPNATNTINAVGIGPILPHCKREFLVFIHYNPITQEFDGVYKERYEEAVQLYEKQINNHLNE